MNLDNYNIQIGHVVRHAPSGPGSQGFEAAIIDIAQDLLFMHLSSEGLFHDVSLKGGTAIRKLYAGKQGRFSTDLDFCTTDTSQSVEDIAFKIVSSIDGLRIKDFTYSISERRNKWYVGIASPFTEGEILKTKLDFSAPSWLSNVHVSPVTIPIHKQYGMRMSKINTVRLEENLSEKIARLNRVSTSRDIYDLNWIMNKPDIKATLNLDLIRLLTVLKIWVDANGLHCDSVEWKTSRNPRLFNPDYWFRDRDVTEVELEDIGALSISMPNVEDMLCDLKRNFKFLWELTNTEQTIAKADARDRSLVLKVLKDLPNGIFANKYPY